MTITIAEARNEYTAIAGQTDFNYTFKIYDSTDLQVFVTPVGAEADDDTDEVVVASVTGVGNAAGGTVTIPATAAGELVTVVSDIPFNRVTDYQVSGDYLNTVVNDDFDRAVSLIKQSQDLLNRTLVGQKSYQNSEPFSLPAPLAEQFLRWKSDLSGLENVTVLDSTILVGTDVGDVVALVDVGGGTPGWPAVDGSLLTGINTDLVNDTTPQLGGNLDLNGFVITAAPWMEDLVDDTTPTLGGPLDGSDEVIKDFIAKNEAEERYAHGSISTNTTINLDNGNVQSCTITGALTFTFSNPAASGNLSIIKLIITNGGSQTITWPGAVTWDGGTAPTLQIAGVDSLMFFTEDAGTTWYGKRVWKEA